jgi:glutamate racemase
MDNVTASSDIPRPETPPRVGFFDSGIGGVSVVLEFVRLRPDAEVYYLADWEYCPYGDKTPEIILARAHWLTRKLLDQGCRLIVVACNTATAVAIDSLRAAYDVPLVGMEPAVKPAALHSKSGVVGILATASTFHGRLYRETSARFSSGVRIVTATGDGFVELVENGDIDSVHARHVVSGVLKPMLAEGVDHIVLGCTHYPFLKSVIQEIAGPDVTVVDPSLPVARRACELLRDGLA